MRTDFLLDEEVIILFTPFQCDLCHFRNVQGRDPILTNERDKLFLTCIRRALLDAFWSREPSTVDSNLFGMRKLSIIQDTLGITTMVPPMGPYCLEDKCGMGLAASILIRSLDPGRTGKYIQFSTAQTLRSVYSNVYHALSKHEDGRAVMAQDTRKIYSTDCPSYSYWFERFMRGLHKRMGEEVRSDYAVSAEVMTTAMSILDEEWERANSVKKRKQTVEIAWILISGYCCGLCGEEIMKLEASGFLKCLADGRVHPVSPHVVTTLLGRFKGETGERWHILPMVWVTRSGLKPGVWGDRLALSLRERNIERGFVFRNTRG